MFGLAVALVVGVLVASRVSTRPAGPSLASGPASSSAASPSPASPAYGTATKIGRPGRPIPVHVAGSVIVRPGGHAVMCPPQAVPAGAATEKAPPACDRAVPIIGIEPSRLGWLDSANGVLWGVAGVDAGWDGTTLVVTVQGVPADGDYYDERTNPHGPPLRPDPALGEQLSRQRARMTAAVQPIYRRLAMLNIGWVNQVPGAFVNEIHVLADSDALEEILQEIPGPPITVDAWIEPR